MADIAKLPSSVYIEQVNVRVEPELKARIVRLKRDRKVDISTELRKVIAEHVAKLEKLTG